VVVGQIGDDGIQPMAQQTHATRVVKRSVESSGEQRRSLRERLASSFGKGSLLSSGPDLCLGEFRFELIRGDSVGEEILHHCPHLDLYGR
jgi:hypothetical protein